jgi:hypothetical protein
MSDMNGEGSPIPQIMMSNPVVEVLTNMLNEAKAGRISSIAVVGITPQSAVAVAYAGGQRGDLYVGFGMIQRRLLQDIEAPAPRSPIIRAAAVG